MHEHTDSIDLIMGWVVATYLTNSAQKLGNWYSFASVEEVQDTVVKTLTSVRDPVLLFERVLRLRDIEMLSLDENAAAAGEKSKSSEDPQAPARVAAALAARKASEVASFAREKAEEWVFGGLPFLVLLFSCLALPCFASRCLALPRFALLFLALPRFTLPCLLLPSHVSRNPPRTAGSAVRSRENSRVVESIFKTSARCPQTWRGCFRGSVQRSRRSSHGRVCRV